jgi:hypothetical protein
MKIPIVGPDASLEFDDLAPLIYQSGSGTVELRNRILRLTLGATEPDARSNYPYSDAQLDDYHLDGTMRWRPPVQMRVRARFSHSASALHGTAGFGFWNDPFGMTGRKSGFLGVRLPQAIWYFFASAPSNMQLAQDVPGFGWKAALLDASSPLAVMQMPFAPLGMLAFRWRWLYRQLWPVAQRLLKIDEMPVTVALESWHDYELVWGGEGARFVVDGETILTTRYAPRGPLGFVAWIDNQFMVATPQGRFRHGVVATATQWMELARLEVAAGAEVS